MAGPVGGSGVRGRADHDLAAVAALREPVRRALYAYVVAQPQPVGRDEAAAATRTRRSLAAFHLDKLADEGLLEVEYRRLSGRQGRGAGRPAKLYRRASRPIAVTIPPRRYELAGRLLAAALAATTSPDTARALAGAARAAGEKIGRESAGSAGSGARRHRPLEEIGTVLADWGYEPARVAEELRLANCPFSALAEEHPEIICGMNLALVEGLLAGAGAGAALEAVLCPQPNRCCVVVRPPGPERRER